MILLELTDDIKFLFPILLAIGFAKCADYIVGPIYDELIELKSMPVIHSSHSNPNVEFKNITEIMTKKIVMFTEIERIAKIQQVRFVFTKPIIRVY